MNSPTRKSNPNSSRIHKFRCPAPDCHCIISDLLVSQHDGASLYSAAQPDQIHQDRRYTTALPLLGYQPSMIGMEDATPPTTVNGRRVFCPTCFTAVLHCECCSSLILDLPTEDQVHCPHCGYLTINDSVLGEQQTGMPPDVLRAIQMKINTPKFIHAIHAVFAQVATQVAPDTLPATMSRSRSTRSSIGNNRSSTTRQHAHGGNSQGNNNKRKPVDFESPVRHAGAALNRNGGGSEIYTEDDSDCSSAVESIMKRRRVGDAFSPPGTLGPFKSGLLSSLRTGDRMARPPCVRRRPRPILNPHVSRDVVLVACHQLRLQLVDPQVLATDKAFLDSFNRRDIDEPMSPSHLAILRALYPDCLDNSHAAQSLAHLGHASVSQQSPLPIRTRNAPVRLSLMSHAVPEFAATQDDPPEPTTAGQDAAADNHAVASQDHMSMKDRDGEGKENLSQGGASQEVVVEESTMVAVNGTDKNAFGPITINDKTQPPQGVGPNADENTDMLIDGAGATPASEPRVGRPLAAVPDTRRKASSSELWHQTSHTSYLYCAQDDAATPSDAKQKHAQLVNILNVLLPVWLARSSDRVACRSEWEKSEDALFEFEHMIHGRKSGSIAGAATAHAVAMRFFVDQRDQCKRAYMDTCRNGIELLEAINREIKDLCCSARTLSDRQRQLRFLNNTTSTMMSNFFSHPVSRRRHRGDTVPDDRYRSLSQQESGGGSGNSTSTNSGRRGVLDRATIGDAIAAAGKAASSRLHKRGEPIENDMENQARCGPNRLTKSAYAESSANSKDAGPDAWLVLQQDIAGIQARVKSWRSVYVAVASACFFTPHCVS